AVAARAPQAAEPATGRAGPGERAVLPDRHRSGVAHRAGRGDRPRPLRTLRAARDRRRLLEVPGWDTARAGQPARRSTEPEAVPGHGLRRHARRARPEPDPAWPAAPAPAPRGRAGPTAVPPLRVHPQRQ